ncbi:bifunctional phosphopantothenoylcysteine decarboxylase/phosphopantothenate--cysteine ligase CoaBC [Allofustis seminis]|uniref:bifunctional phosphopantothenoylcysteine decarboxylase/phosphopantothenate--cysteine ligase CoaBC n=1 Tax=Allofustis seminis TaxID=166939 RepID=UPI0003706DD9|nr:bifunctional phosphopantothenoylcysteine decarboxylase/phosphopantothenate--cysteine ligase CoaBC [Allofustis seminis]
MVLKDKNIALYVTGGVAIYKTLDLLRTFIKKGAHVRVAMTPAARAFISPLLFEKLSKHRVYTDLFSDEDPERVDHIEIADWSDLAVVAPATANTIAKMSVGIADNIVTSALLASTCPIFVIPAMNENMYNNPATQRNCDILRRDGFYVMEPDAGFLAEGYEGKGRFPVQDRIIEELEQFILKNTSDLPLQGKKIIVTAGGTREAIDPVRFISNRSSGKMGHALAEAAFFAGAEVVLVTASPLGVHRGIQMIHVESAQEMAKYVNHLFSEADGLIMAAAVSDYRVAKVADHKLKKQEKLTLELQKNPDILKELGQQKQDQLLIGFAAETENLLEYANQKLISKNLDAIVANYVAISSQGFDVDDNSGYIISTDGSMIEIPKMSKKEMAEEIIHYVIDQLTKK